MRHFDKVLLAISLAAPLLLTTLAWPKLFEWITAPAPRPTPEASVATATPGEVAVQAISVRPTSTPPPTSTISKTAVTAAQPTAPMPTPEAQRATPATLAGSVATVVPTLTDAPAEDPVEAVSQFYALVSSRQFDAAEELWSASMRSAYPPHENIVRRFSQTDAIGLERADLVAQNHSRATIAANVLETDVRGATRRFVGRWHLVRGPSGWLLDRPELQAAP
jgi:hypothetical protein